VPSVNGDSAIRRRADVGADGAYGWPRLEDERAQEVLTMAVFEVVTSRRLWRRVGIMYALGAPFVLIGIVAAADAHGTDRVGLIAILVVMLLLPFLHFAMRSTWVRRFDAQGVTTYGRRSFAWTDFQRVDKIMRRQWLSHRELVFAGGRVVVPPGNTVENPVELTDIVLELERGQNRFTK